MSGSFDEKEWQALIKPVLLTNELAARMTAFIESLICKGKIEALESVRPKNNHTGPGIHMNRIIDAAIEKLRGEK
jgi:hypothetical protein